PSPHPAPALRLLLAQALLPARHSRPPAPVVRLSLALAQRQCLLLRPPVPGPLSLRRCQTNNRAVNSGDPATRLRLWSQMTAWSMEALGDPGRRTSGFPRPTPLQFLK